MSKHCLIFDLDDTLYAERDFAISAFGAAGSWAAAKHGIAGLDADMTALLDQGHLGKIFSLALQARLPGHTAHELEALRAVYLTHTPPTLPLFADAARALDHFSAQADVKLGLITDGTATVQAAKIEALGIGPKFQQVILTGGLGAGRAFHKPHPLAFERMQDLLADPGDWMIYVGDNPAKDFQAPNRLGWMTVQVDRPSQRAFNIHRGAPALSGGSAHHVIPSLDDLSRLIGGGR